MRLLITTQAVDRDDPVLGFFHRWLEEFASQCESIEVICLKEGNHSLPGNVRVHSLGKESGRSKIKYIFNFYRYIFSLRNRYDAVFVHMNPEYVVLGGVFWKSMHKRIGLWYVHRHVSMILKIAVWLADFVCTSARESITLASEKIKIVGHGIDVAAYAKAPKMIDTLKPCIVSVGRITPIKRIEVMIDAMALLHAAGIPAMLELIGAPVYPSDDAYKSALELRIRKSNLSDSITFIGALPHAQVQDRLARYDFSINAAPTGGIDKAVLESCAAGVPAVVCNRAFSSYFGEYIDALLYEEGSGDALAEKIKTLCMRTDLASMQANLKTLVKQKADIAAVIPAILALYK